MIKVIDSGKTPPRTQRVIEGDRTYIVTPRPDSSRKREGDKGAA